MKNKLNQLITTFVITFIAAFVSTNNQNLIYNILNTLGYENDVLQKTILSAVITLIIGLFSILGSFLWTAITSIIKKMDITLNTKINGKKKDAIKFTPSSYEYDSQEIEIEIILQPKGKLSSLLIKSFGVSLDVYFNPELIDVSYLDRWDYEENQIFKIYERKISIDLLGKMDIKGRTFSGKSHKLNECFIVKPIRVKNAETYLDYVIVSNKFGKFGKFLSGYLLSVKYEPLKVNCEGDVK